MNPQNRSHLGVLLAFFVAATAVTWPLVLHFNDGIPYGGDSFQFIWNGWWFSKALGDPALSVWYTPYQYAPNGTSLVLHDLSPLNALMQAILSGWIGMFAAHNLLILLHYVLGAWGAYILAWYLTGNRPASVTAGVIYGFSMHHAMHLSQLGTISSGWLPLSIYYLLKFTRDGGWRDGVLSIVMLLAAAMSHWYQFAFAGVCFFGLMLIGQVGLKDHLDGAKRWMRAVGPWIVALLILGPLILASWRETAAVGAQHQVEMGMRYYLDPAWLLLPSPTHPILGGLSKPFLMTIPGNTTEGVVSLGIVAIVLGILSWFRRDATTRAWCWLGLVIFLLALGSVITILGWNTGVPGPFVIWSAIPGLNLIRIPARFIGPFTLTLGIAAAGWIAGLQTEWRLGFRRFFLLWFIPAIIVFETLTIPVPVVGREFLHPALGRLPGIYMEATGTTEPPDLIVNFPLLPLRREYLLQQTIHELPTVDGALSYPPAGAMDFFFGFNWNPDYVKSIGIDMVLFHPWVATPSLGEHFKIPEDATGRAADWAGQKVEPEVFFRGVMGYRVAYEDDGLIVFVP